MCARDEEHLSTQELAPAPGRSAILTRTALAAAWVAAVVSLTLYVAALVIYGPADAATEHFRAAVMVAVIVSVIVSCWYSNRRRAERLEARQAAAEPDYEKGFGDGDRNGMMRVLNAVKPWLPADVFIQVRNGHDHHVS